MIDVITPIGISPDDRVLATVSTISIKLEPASMEQGRSVM